MNQAKRCRGRFQCEQAVNQAAHSKAEAARRCVSNLILRSREWDRESFRDLAKSLRERLPENERKPFEAAREQVKGLHESVLRRTPSGRWGEPADLSGIAVFLSSKASDFVTGTAIPVDGGYSVQG